MNKHMVGEFTVLLKEHHPYEQADGWGVNSLIIKGAPPYGQAYIWEFTVLLKEHHPYEQAYGWGVYSLINKGAAPS